MSFNWVPPTGLNDTSSFPSKDTGFRAHMQALLDQVKTYINTNLVSDNSLQLNGWRRLPDGSTEQWGSSSVLVSAGYIAGTLTFPIAFPTACLNVVATIRVVDGGGTMDNDFTISVISMSPTTLGYKIKNIVNAYGSTVDYRWRAIGY